MSKFHQVFTHVSATLSEVHTCTCAIGRDHDSNLDEKDLPNPNDTTTPNPQDSSTVSMPVGNLPVLGSTPTDTVDSWYDKYGEWNGDSEAGKEAKAALKALIARERLEEITNFNDAVAQNGWHNGAPQQFLYIVNRIAALEALTNTQKEKT